MGIGTHDVKVVAIVGPTAVLKSAIAIEVAFALEGEIVSADAFQVYCGLDIGTAKVATALMQGIRHHMLDIANPIENFSVAEFQKLAREAVWDIFTRGKLPIIVGGSGLYYRAIVDDLRFPVETEPGESRLDLQDLGAEALYELLLSKDPQAAASVDRSNCRRLIRAIERSNSANKAPVVWDDYRSIYDLQACGLSMDRARLYDRIDARVDEMIGLGLIDEVKGLREAGVKTDSTAMQAIGYRQVCQYLDGDLGYDEMVDLIKRKTRNLAKRQFTWFYADNRIKWYDIEEIGIIDRIIEHIRSW